MIESFAQLPPPIVSFPEQAVVVSLPYLPLEIIVAGAAVDHIRVQEAATQERVVPVVAGQV